MPSPPTPLVLLLGDSIDPAVVGNKAATLGRFIRAGFPVPPGLCVTTAAYRLAAEALPFDVVTEWQHIRRMPPEKRTDLLAKVREQLITAGLPQPAADALDSLLPLLQETAQSLLRTEPNRWAVRSSATQEDAEGRSYGGLYLTTLGASLEELPVAIARCWASLWREPAASYAERMGDRMMPTMAVLIQPLLSPVAAGVAFSRHPLLETPAMVVINAVHGLADELVAGRVTPDQYIVQDGAVVARDIAEKVSQRLPGRQTGVASQPLPVPQRREPALTEDQVLELAGMVQAVEQHTAHPVDVEWARSDALWLLQSRPIIRPRPSSGEAPPSDLDHACTWSRANFMETLPELPSPLSLQFVRQFMEANILSHYRKLGCRIPQGVSSVRISHGRPYINVTLFQSLMAQLGSDPRSIAEYMGGEAPSLSQPIPLPMSRLPFGPWIRAVSVLQGKIWHAAFTASRWFEQLSRLAASQWDPSVEQLTEEQLLARMTAIQARLEGQDLTFAIVSGVSQAFYVIGATLSQRCTNWRALLNAATQGLGTIVSARQILWLQELAEEARVEPKARAFLSRTPWQPADFRTELTGTRLLDAFEAFLKEYGHRAIGESDVRSPRFAETPEYLLGIIRTHLMAQETVAVRSVTTILQEQAAIRATALAEIRERFGARLHQWLWFVTWYRTLAKFLALREANRHALMRYVAAARHLLQILGRKLSDRGLLETAEDLFYLTGDEIRTIVAGAPGEETCRAVIQTRREERQRHAAVAAPQTIQDAVVSPNGPPAAGQPIGEDSLHGVPISAGVVEGPVRVVLTVAELQQTQRGEIVVTVALDPGMAPMFAVAAGLVVEIGGILSHGAIIAREYGIPALANVTAATTRLKAGDWVRLDADRGEVRRVKGPA